MASEEPDAADLARRVAALAAAPPPGQALDAAVAAAKDSLRGARAARLAARREALGGALAGARASLAARVARGFAAAPGGGAPAFAALEARVDAALAAARRGRTVAGVLRAVTERLYAAWGGLVLACLCWLLGVPRGGGGGG